MTRPVRNIAASKRERLANRARSHGETFDLVMRRYFFERLLYRLSVSPVSQRFVLKGAMLFQLWADRPYRSTVDLDLLRKGTRDDDALTADLRIILDQGVDRDDGVRFDRESLIVEPIRTEDEYAGVRVRVIGRLGSIMHRLQVDVGTADSVWPAPARVTFPTLLDDPAPHVLAYPRETAIAEKVEAMVALGIRNSRMKDFFDVHYLAAHFDFDGATLAEAIRRTFAKRKTPIPSGTPIGLTAEFWNDSARTTQLGAFGKRSRLPASEVDPARIVPLLVQFVIPVFMSLKNEGTFPGLWKPGGPWI